MNKQDLIKKINALQDITNDEKSYLIDLVNTKKKYGLVWEDKPEDVEEQLRSMLPVFAELKDRAIISEDAEAPNHILIEGDNLHALTALSYTHEGKIDVIYIDPPYNTGNKDFIYNDQYVDKEDTYRHSKWLSFVEKRLKIAKQLLSEKGVIFISIDDNEQAQLKMLCDEIFHNINFIGSVIWHNSSRASGNQISTVHEYLHVYGKSIATIPIWKTKRSGFEKIVEKVKKEWPKNPVETKKLLQLFIQEKLIEDEEEFKFLKNYSNIDNNGRIFYAVDLSGDGQGEPKRFGDITLPAPKGRHWMSQEFIDNLYKEDRIIWKGKRPYRAVYLDESEERPQGIVRYPTRTGRHQLKDILQKEIFNNPKPTFLIQKFLKLSSNLNSTILDFFAGSGTTLHATMALNAEDGGNRQCILVTNNENNIAEEVTYERNKRVIQGYNNTKGDAVKGLAKNNLRYFKSDFVPSERTEINRRLLTARSTDLLCIKEDCFINVSKEFDINTKQAQMFTNGLGKYMVVVYHSRNQNEISEQLVAIIKNLETTEKIKVYAFSPERETIEDDFFEVADSMDAVPLPDSIYNAYRATFRSLKLNKKEAKTITPKEEN